MRAYDEWKSTQPEPPRGHFRGTCKQCGAEHIDGTQDRFETEPCAAPECKHVVCECCDRCSYCQSGVCRFCQRWDEGNMYCRFCFQEHIREVVGEAYSLNAANQ